jgi:hypothetical protein
VEFVGNPRLKATFYLVFEWCVDVVETMIGHAKHCG